jgi:hypothetical protein
MVKFTNLDLDGYGFDLAADRVVRFSKHPDGTYLNTRATYSINKNHFTHFDLRTQAIKDQSLGEIHVERPLHKTYKRWMVVTIFILVIVSLGECSFEASSNVTLYDTE